MSKEDQECGSMSDTLFYIIGIKTEGKYHQLATALTEENARKIRQLIQITIKVTGGKGIADVTEVTE